MGTHKCPWCDRPTKSEEFDSNLVTFRTRDQGERSYRNRMFDRGVTPDGEKPAQYAENLAELTCDNCGENFYVPNGPP
jgi:hypothetical protein